MSAQPTRKSRLAWIIPATIAAIIFIGGVAGNLIAEDLKNFYSSHPKPVWAVFALALAATIVGVIWDHYRNRETKPPAGKDHAETQSHITIGGSVSGGQIANVTASRNPGNVAGRDINITNIRQSSPPPPNPLHQLPPPTPDFTGRENELAELRRHLQSGVAICGAQGMGGVGKTALALRLADELKPRYPDAQFYLDLKGVSPEPLSPARAMEHVIRAYHPAAKLPDDEHQIAALFRSALEGKRALLLWDNARDAAQVAPLRPPDGCLMLVTSRKHFMIPGLHSVDLDSMRPEEARALLLRIEPRIGGAAARMAELCGHLPLALELAANGLKVRKSLSPSDYLGRLEQSERRIAALDRTDAERKLAPTLESSYALLDDGQQRLWRALAVFPGGFDHRAAAAVWEMDAEEARDALDDLAALSLVVFDPAKSRYRLHDLPRVFADARLSESERDALRLKHAAHYGDLLALADEQYLAGGAEIMAGLSLYDQERGNIEAGQTWAAARIRQDRNAARLAAEWTFQGNYVLSLRQRPRERIAWLDAGVRACREIGDRRGEGNALGNLGIAYKDLGEVRKAIEYYEQHLEIAREIGDRRGEGAALGNLGNAYAALGEVSKAIEYYEQALVIDREIGDRRGEGADLGNLGVAYKNLGEVRKAIEYYEQQIEIARGIGDRRGEANALYNWGNALAQLGEGDRAIEMIEAALAIYEQIESPWVETARKRLAELKGE